MKKEALLKKIAKLGLKVQEGFNGEHFIEHNGDIASWRYEFAYADIDGEYQKTDKLEARGFHIRSKDDHTDLMTDYFAGYYCDNATQMLNSLCPPKPKFPVGSLVRGKQNKRAIRQGYAGKIGLVMSAGQYMKIDWCGEAKPAYEMSYPQRDIELVSSAA